jgi:ATP-binding cassette subfamily B protein
VKDLWRVIRFTKNLWRYYALVSIFTILLAIMSQLQPLFTKAVIDQASKLLSGGKPDIKVVAILAVAMFLTDWAQTWFSNIGGYYGDILTAKLRTYMSERYYEHILSLPQSYFDTELSGEIINRMTRGINQIADFIQTVSNNFLQFIFGTVFSLIIVPTTAGKLHSCCS